MNKNDQQLKKRKKIVVIGGGTGTFVTLTGLKSYPVDLCAIVTMMDSGGSTGRLRDQLGVLPPGDLRQALVALSNSDKLWRDLFLYRFENGDLKGHNFGNIFLSAIEKVTGSLKDAIRVASMILDVKGIVIPVTFSNVELCVRLADNRIITGETHIDEPQENELRAKIIKAYLQPSAKVNPDAIEAIKQADMIVFGPGDLYTSIIPNVLVEGMSQAIQQSKAVKVFVMNLMTKYGQTTEYSAQEHLEDLEKYLDCEVQNIIVNCEKPDALTLNLYKKSNEKMVTDNLSKTNRTIIKKRLLDHTSYTKKNSDILKRSLIRHDPKRLASSLFSLV